MTKYKRGQKFVSLVDKRGGKVRIKGKVYTVSRDTFKIIWYIGEDGQEYNSTEPDSMLFITDPPKTEIEWLDRVQINFKHG